MAKGKGKKTESIGDMAKDLKKMTADLGIKTANPKALKVTIETADAGTIVFDPNSCQASMMSGMEDMGVSFTLSGKVREGKPIYELNKDLGANIANPKALKIILETADMGNLLLDPLQCSITMLSGMEEYGGTLSFKAKIKEGQINFI